MKWDYIEFNGKHPKATKGNRVYSDSADPSWVDYGVRYPEGYLKIDIDDRDHKTGALEEPIKGKPRSSAVIELLQNLGVRFIGIQTDHGVHLIFKAPDPERLVRKNKQNWISLINVKMEWKFPESDDHIPLQVNGIERKIICNPSDVDPLPFYLYPLQKNRERPFQMDFPEGNRTNQLGGYIFHLIEKYGLSAEDAFEVVRLMNRYIFNRAIPDDLLQSQILNGSTLQKAESLQKAARNKEISPEVFSRFLMERGCSVRYNKLLNIIEYDGINGELPEDLKRDDPQNATPIQLQHEFRKYTKKAATKQQVIDLIVLEADKHSYNPVQNYLKELVWDQHSRFPEVFQILGVTDPFEEVLIKKWFFQTAAMAFNNMSTPFQAEGVLILQGAEGIGKTRFFQQLVPDPNWFSSLDKELTTKNKDILIQMLSVWIGEIGEIDRTFKANKSDIKNFITNRDDRIRKPYRPEPVTKARTTSFCGTTNKSTFLTDDSGSRRWWVIEIHKKIKMDFFSDPAELHQLWAECYAAYSTDPTCFRLNDDEIQTLESRNKAMTEMLPAEEELRNRLNFDAPVTEWNWVIPSALKDLTGYDVQKYSAKEIGAALRVIMKDFPEMRFRRGRNGNQFFLPPAVLVDRYGTVENMINVQ